MNTRMQAQPESTSIPSPAFTPARSALLQRRATNQAELATVPPIVHEALRSPGQPLDPDTRTFMEPRFGHDFSRVQVHTDAEAAEAARAVNARAYTMGHDIVFAQSAHQPATERGKWLMAHELAHVVQQTREVPDRQGSTQPRFPAVSHPNAPLLQRMSLGRGTPPVWSSPVVLAEVPVSERPRVNAAIRLVRTVADNPADYDDCHRFFAENCPGGSANSMQTTFNNAVLWKLTVTSEDEDARGEVNGNNIAYSQRGYDRGEHRLAQTLVHEMMHNCGITSRSEHHLADVAGLYCIGARNRVFASLGIGLSAWRSLFVDMLSYRRILAEWASGRIQLTAGGDVNFSGLLMEGIRAAMGEERPPGEFGSAMVGVSGRTNLLWGGERYGGLTGSIETGVGAGRFQVSSPEAGEGPATSVEGDLVLRVGVGAEFYLPIGREAVPVSIEVAYRLAQPLNEEATRIHSFVLRIGHLF